MFRSPSLIFSSGLPSTSAGIGSSSFLDTNSLLTTSLLHMNHQMSPSTSSPTPSGSAFKGERCVGCSSDSTIRVHYGAPSCHGCKAFFRRSVFEGRIYVCSSDNSCHITNESRNRCRACRFRNCLEGGMNPKHVREERSKIERIQPQVNASSSENPNSDQEASCEKHEAPPEVCQLTQFICALEQQTEILTDEDVNELNLGDWSREITLSLGIQNPRLVIQRTPMNWRCERIMNANDVFSSWYRAFVLLADWAMGFPDFRVIPLVDQTELFKQNFMAFGWITYSYKCYENHQDEIGIPLGNGAYIPYTPEAQQLMEEKWISTYGVVCQKLIDLTVKPIRELEMNKEEYCLLKTISLFQQDCTMSTTAVNICKRVTDRLLEALSKSIDRNFPHLTTIQKNVRSMKILLLIPCFNHIGVFESSIIQTLSDNDRNELSGVPMEIMNSHVAYR